MHITTTLAMMPIAKIVAQISRRFLGVFIVACMSAPRPLRNRREYRVAADGNLESTDGKIGAWDRRVG